MAAIMKSLCFFFIILASSSTLFTVADAWRFNVGGNGVWAINPKENYNTWAERNRFQVNDTLYFKYPKGSDSVQQVMKADFDGCNIRNPLKNFDDGESVFTFNRSGPFYFISGNQDHCKKGQKLIVVVLAIRNHTTHPISPAKPPSTVQPPKSSSPVPAVAPAKPPSVTQPPKSHPTVSPAQPPSKPQPPKSSVPPVSPTQSPKSQPPKSSVPPVSPTQSPKSQPPKSSVPSVSPTLPPKSSDAPSHSPSTSPASPSHSPTSPPPASSPSPSSSSPAQSPTSSPPEQTPPFSPSPSESTPTADNVTAPAPGPKKSASSKAVISVTATVLSVALTILISA